MTHYKMTHDETIRILSKKREGISTTAPLRQALDIAIGVLERQERVKTRLAQIASGDYKACGHTAEKVAKTALAELCGERHAAPGKAIDHSEQVLDMVTPTDSSTTVESISRSDVDQFDERMNGMREHLEEMGFRGTLGLLADMQAHIRKLHADIEIADDTATHFKLAYQNLRSILRELVEVERIKLIDSRGDEYAKRYPKVWARAEEAVK